LVDGDLGELDQRIGASARSVALVDGDLGRLDQRMGRAVEPRVSRSRGRPIPLVELAETRVDRRWRSREARPTEGPACRGKREPVSGTPPSRWSSLPRPAWTDVAGLGKSAISHPES
jgi:hypothetical protein